MVCAVTNQSKMGWAFTQPARLRDVGIERRLVPTDAIVSQHHDPWLGSAASGGVCDGSCILVFCFRSRLGAK